MSVSHKKSGGSGAYYINCMLVAGKDADKAIAEYYASATLDSAKEKAGIWYAGLNADGTRASHLGIVDGLVFESVNNRSDVKIFSRLCQGFHGLNGDKCVKNAGSQKRVAFHDFTLSHPKDVTVLWAFSDDKTKAMIEMAQEVSARVFLDFMSQHAISRQGTDGVVKTPAPLRGATFMHRSSRENDPLLHTHCVVLNICERPDGTTGSLETCELMKYQGAGASLAHASMAWSLRQLRFNLEKAGKLYKTGHVPADVIKNFSKRHEQIVKATEARMLAMGMKPDAIKASREMRQLANAQTKANKSKLTMEQLQALWNVEGARLGFGQKEVAALMHAGVPVELTKEQLFKEAQDAVRGLTENAAVFREPQLIVAIATHLVGRASPTQIMAAVEQVKNEILLRTISEKIQGKGTAFEARTEETLYSTREMVALEHRMMDLATTTNTGHVFDMSRVKLSASLKDEQRQAIVQILSDPLMVTLVNGAPGAGKTFAMGELARAVEIPCGKGQGGGKVLGLSGSWSASLNLKDEAGLAEGRAITGWVLGVRSGKIVVEPRTVIMVDEAGQVSAADMEAILSIAKAHGCKVVLLGDLQQQKGAGAGDAFRCMAAHLKPAELNEIVRQNKQEDRKAVKLLLAGGVNTVEGLQNFIDQGAVHIVIGDDETNARMAADWQAMREARPAQLALEQADFERRCASGTLNPREKPPAIGLHLMLAADKVSVAALNALAHAHRKAAGELGQSLRLRNLDCAKDETVEFSVNDRVAFRINSVGDCVSFSRKKNPQAEVRQDGIIESAAGDILAVRMGSGELVNINQRKIKVFNRQVGTIERIQGHTLHIRTQDGRLFEMDTQAEKWAHQDGGTGLQHAYASTVYSAQGLTVMTALCKSAVNTNSAQTGVALSRHTSDAHVYIDKQAHYEKKMSECRTDDWHHIDEYSDAECMKSVVAAMAQASKKGSTLDYEIWQESAGAKIEVQAEVTIRQRAATQTLARSELERIRQASRYQEITPIASLPYQGRHKFALKEIEENPRSTILGIKILDKFGIDPQVVEDARKLSFLRFDTQGQPTYCGRRPGDQALVNPMTDERIETSVRGRFPPILLSDSQKIDLVTTGREALALWTIQDRDRQKRSTVIVTNGHPDALGLPHTRALIEGAARVTRYETQAQEARRRARERVLAATRQGRRQDAPVILDHEDATIGVRRINLVEKNQQALREAEKTSASEMYCRSKPSPLQLAPGYLLPMPTPSREIEQEGAEALATQKHVHGDIVFVATEQGFMSFEDANTPLFLGYRPDAGGQKTPVCVHGGEAARTEALRHQFPPVLRGDFRCRRVDVVSSGMDALHLQTMQVLAGRPRSTVVVSGDRDDALSMPHIREIVENAEHVERHDMTPSARAHRAKSNAVTRAGAAGEVHGQTTLGSLAPGAARPVGNEAGEQAHERPNFADQARQASEAAQRQAAADRSAHEKQPAGTGIHLPGAGLHKYAP